MLKLKVSRLKLSRDSRDSRESVAVRDGAVDCQLLSTGVDNS